MTKQYLRKREYLGFIDKDYYLKYGRKIVNVTMQWISGEYQIKEAHLIYLTDGLEEFPYRRTVKTIDRIEELLKE